MKILQVDLISSTPGTASPRSPVRSQIVFVGRSNVGKSSLINALIRRKLARTSRSPGKTDLVNIYRVRLAVTARQVEMIDFVDLPGYGYARGGAFHPWSGQRPAIGTIRCVTAVGVRQQAPVQRYGPVPGVQGMQGGVPLQR